MMSFRALAKRWRRMKRRHSAPRAVCQWERHDNYYGNQSDGWHTGCGDDYLLLEGTPADNYMNYCPYCGGELVDVTPPLEEWDDDE